ncbi:MAG: 2-oxoglutarate dehydrogenase E1 component, partial [Gammaproteobacteria bacterium]
MPAGNPVIDNLRANFMSKYEQMKKTSALSGGSASFVEDLYESYLNDPASVPQNWQVYFADLQNGATINEKPRLVIQDKFAILSKLPKTGGTSDASIKQTMVDTLIGAYRNAGHKAADIDPLHFRDRDTVEDLDYRYHGLSEADLEESFATGTLFTDKPHMKLRDIIAFLQDVYTTTVGAEVNHINTIEEKRWIQERLERFAHKPKATREQKQEILENLVRAEGLERYLHTRYVGQKRFSLEGGDSLIPMMDRVIQRLGDSGTKEIVIGMAHRGRLNVLINIMGKLPELLFDEFEGLTVKKHTSGDVKYHLGFSSDIETAGGACHLSLAFNPSHLEIVNPVVQGSVRARMERHKRGTPADTVMEVANEVVPILIHGDAAFANQGVIQETLQLSQVRGYRVGGTVHVILNNQIGFTTSNLEDVRSSLYCSDPAKIVEAPVFHVNGDDPEAVAMVSEIAADYLHKFNKDVVLDLVCYRRLGHNEADEPAVTQPKMYGKIRSHPTPLTLYSQKLIKEGISDQASINALINNYKTTLDAGKPVSRPVLPSTTAAAIKAWRQFTRQDWQQPVDTTYDKTALASLAQRVFSYPES